MPGPHFSQARSEKHNLAGGISSVAIWSTAVSWLLSALPDDEPLSSVKKHIIYFVDTGGQGHCVS